MPLPQPRDQFQATAASGLRAGVVMVLVTVAMGGHPGVAVGGVLLGVVCALLLGWRFL